MNKKSSFYKTIMIVLITAIITLLLSTILMYNFFRLNPSTKYVFVGKDNTNLQDSISGIREILDKYYYGTIPDNSNMVEGAIKGYVAALGDEYSEYMTSDEWKEYKEEALGNYTGLGVYFVSDDSGMKISKVIKGSPAEKSGLQLDDIVTKVDDMICTKDNMNEVTDYIKDGEVGSKFKIEFLRNGQTMNKEITRETVRAIQVQSEIMENNIGYIKLLTFDNGSAEDFKNNCNDLIKKGAKAIVLDLRNNTGGVLQEALSMAEMLLNKNDKIIMTSGKVDGEKTYKVEKDQQINLPMAVLTNEYSASASEILVAALKDNKRATIIGTKTYGKGVMQEVLNLSNGAALKVTTDEFVTPNGDKINKVGIAPDINIELPEKYTNIIYVPKNEDNQLQKSIEVVKTEIK